AIEDVGAKARRVAAVLGHRQQVDRDVLVEHRDVRVAADRLDQRALDLSAGDVLPVHDAVVGVGALAAEVELAARAAREPHAEGVVHFTNLKPSGGKWKKVMLGGPDFGSKASARRGNCERCDKVPATDTSPERFHRYDPYIVEASQLYRIPVPLIRAVIKVES